MAKWYGPIGYVETVETKPGVWVEQVTEHNHFGDMLPNMHLLQTSGGVVDDINVSNKLSIVADPYAFEHYDSMRYAEFRGARWKITSIEVLYPRLILTLGGLWNGKQA